MSVLKHRVVRYTIAIIVIFTVAVGAQFLRQADRRTTASASGKAGLSNLSAIATVSEARAINSQAYARPPAQLPDLGPLPASLRGAEPEVVLRTDEQGNLVPEQDLMVLFDFYLSALGEESLDLLLARIQRSLDDQLDGQALTQARDLLRRYVDYKIALAEVEDTAVGAASNGELSVADLRQRFQAMTALRQDLFSSEESVAFFQLDNVQDEYMLQRLAIEQNSLLNEQQRQQALAALEQTLPEEIRTLRKRVTRNAELYAVTEAMRQAGAGAEQIYKVRAEALGDEAAANLAQLDRERAQWKQRLSDYARERETIRQSGLSHAEREAALDTLIDSRFTELERLRVRALDSIKGAD